MSHIAEACEEVLQAEIREGHVAAKPLQEKHSRLKREQEELDCYKSDLQRELKENPEPVDYFRRHAARKRKQRFGQGESILFAKLREDIAALRARVKGEFDDEVRVFLQTSGDDANPKRRRLADIDDAIERVVIEKNMVQKEIQSLFPVPKGGWELANPNNTTRAGTNASLDTSRPLQSAAPRPHSSKRNLSGPSFPQYAGMRRNPFRGDSDSETIVQSDENPSPSQSVQQPVFNDALIPKQKDKQPAAVVGGESAANSVQHLSDRSQTPLVAENTSASTTADETAAVASPSHSSLSSSPPLLQFAKAAQSRIARGEDHDDRHDSLTNRPMQSTQPSENWQRDGPPMRSSSDPQLPSRGSLNCGSPEARQAFSVSYNEGKGETESDSDT
ncbi:uncharacterized protein RCC_04989 [Ramularia collo-cygni]|uniref:Uncharacterized protein n=1 Tax=Ramularia collo-cygni TaxID=112498 RepID=A0A2D3VEU9_9PEZI|nr:uncharacterized protein RCC_04989 [Ramularia collo-cygni]CZT19143.1 uncharacterized protein RCC_04989 [Ramularia collo-cygni]